MSTIPQFAQAVQEFESFLHREGIRKRLIWAFRDDLWQCGRTRVLLRWPASNHTCELIEKVFAEGRAKDLVEIVAVAQARDWIVATVWYPKYEDEEMQGWSENLKLAIRQPLPWATRVPSMLWNAFAWLPSFRRYQTDALGIGTRRWAAS